MVLQHDRGLPLVHETRLTAKRSDATSRNIPNAISSVRRESLCAILAPYDAVTLDKGAIRANPMSDTNPIDSGGKCA